MESINWLAIFGSYLTISFGVYRLFKEADEVIKEETRIVTSIWLLNLEVKNLSKWPSQFIRLFDKVFGKNMWSVIFMSKSFAATTYIIFLFI